MPEPNGKPTRPVLAIPPGRSVLPELAWPAIPEPRTARLLAMLFQLEQSQWWPETVIRRYQFQQLALVLRHAFKTIKFYRDRMLAARIKPGQPIDPDAWARMPILTRADLQRLGPEIVSKAVPKHHGSVGSLLSSGSTGRPVIGHTTGVTRLMWSVLSLRDLLWHRRDLSLKLAGIRWFATDKAMPPQGLRQEHWGSDSALPFRTGRGVALNIKSTIREQADWLVREDPDYVVTYPSNLVELSKHFQAHGLRLGRLRGVSTLSEICTDETRRWCRDVFGVDLADIYSAREVGYMALQCPDHHHYHVQSESVLVEILDADNCPCRPGEAGRVVVTTLLNFAAPLLRYEIGDLAEVGGPCSCGRGLPVLNRILGRVRNTLQVPSGDRIWPVLNLQEAAQAIPFKQIQLVQQTHEEIEVRLVPEGSPSAEDEQKFAAAINKFLLFPFRIFFNYMDEIPRSPGGKYEDFMSMVP
jgi:phenylacetate-CoA ligase